MPRERSRSPARDYDRRTQVASNGHHLPSSSSHHRSSEVKRAMPDVHDTHAAPVSVLNSNDPGHFTNFPELCATTISGLQ